MTFMKKYGNPSRKNYNHSNLGSQSHSNKNKIKKYKTYKEQIKKESEQEVQRNIGNLNNMYEGLPTYEE